MLSTLTCSVKETSHYCPTFTFLHLVSNFHFVVCSPLDLQQHDPNFYNTITNSLNEEQRTSLQEIFTLADQRRAAAESKEIQKRGGKCYWIYLWIWNSGCLNRVNVLRFQDSNFSSKQYQLLSISEVASHPLLSDKGIQTQGPTWTYS